MSCEADTEMPIPVGKRGFILGWSLEDLCTSRSPESPNMLSPGLLISSQLNPSQLLVLVYSKTFYWEGRLLLRVA